MNYYLYKFEFDTAAHFGPSDSSLSLASSDDHFCADTLFSALCHTALSLYGKEKLEDLCCMAEKGALRLSDSMPYRDELLFLPKPCMSSKHGNVCTEPETQEQASERKALKKLAWIPVSDLSVYMQAQYSRGSYNIGNHDTSFGVRSTAAKVQILPGEDALPYSIGLYSFKENCGLWIIAGTETEEQNDFIRVLLEGLGLSGIGGKTSSGYGKFHIVDEIALDEPFDTITEFLCAALSQDKEKTQLLLTTSLPSDEELINLIPDAEYRLVRRGGFVASGSYSETPRKKRAQYFLAAGSVLTGRYASQFYDVGEAGRHPVYRFSGPVFLGLEGEGDR